MYKATETGIGPETIQWIPAECNSTSTSTTKSALLDWKLPPNQSPSNPFYQENGFWIVDGTYNLRPEVLESYYYAYRITHDPIYQEWAWEAFVAINRTARLQHGFNFLGDVNAKDGMNLRGNAQESYFFSETLKYAYLIFSRDGEWQVNHDGDNHFVYNTEGHPLRVPLG
jgi:mannosyl-oligosaccharide alpha-1,2-mannosidase